MSDEKQWIRHFIDGFNNLRKYEDNNLLTREGVIYLKSSRIGYRINGLKFTPTVSDLICLYMVEKYYELTQIPNVINYQSGNVWKKILKQKCKEWSDDNINNIISIMRKGFVLNRKCRAESFSDITGLKEYQQLCKIIEK